jgi:Fic family protein
MTETEIEFLRESNAIEGVFDDDSLQQAKYAWEYLLEQKEINTGVVLKLHKILMLHQKLQPDQKGYFRRVQVWVGGREGLDWHFLHENMDVWCLDASIWPNNWKVHHVRYEFIHPFVDGNGRTGRMLMNWERLKARLPIKVIKAKNRQTYYKWFKSI